MNILQFTIFDQTNNFVRKLSGKLMVKTKFKIPNSSHGHPQVLEPKEDQGERRHLWLWTLGGGCCRHRGLEPPRGREGHSSHPGRGRRAAPTLSLQRRLLNYILISRFFIVLNSDLNCIMKEINPLDFRVYNTERNGTPTEILESRLSFIHCAFLKFTNYTPLYPWTHRNQLQRHQVGINLRFFFCI